MNSKLILILPAATLLIAALVWWKQQAPSQAVYSLPVATNCQLHSTACSVTYKDATIRLDVTPKPIPIAKALTIQTDIKGIAPLKVQLDINGSNMYMGYNRITLNQQADGAWTGKSLLAFCTTDAMSWQLTLLIDLPDGSQLQAPFPLITPFSQ
jgi:hypothetical protein